MDSHSLRIILEKLNDAAGQVLEQAVGFAASRGHAQVTPEHLFVKCLESTVDTKAQRLLEALGVNMDTLWHDLIESVNQCRSGFQEKPAVSESLYYLLEKACALSALYYQNKPVDTAMLVHAVVELSARLPGFQAYRALDNLHSTQIREVLVQLADAPAAKGSAPKTANGQSALEQFAIDLTSKARNGELEPITGRAEEIRKAIDILCRRRKNNPILIGEAGVGKTAVVEGLAQKIVANEVPTTLRNIEIWVLDMGLLQAGASVKGEFERRLKQVIDEVKQSAGRIMLFIDEAHTLIGAGGEAGLNDAANLLKPALARGELRTIAATTFREYKQYFERDPALVRRFQQIQVDEPTTEAAILMLNGIRTKYQEHHQVLITDSAIEAAVKLSQRYITGRYLPDKAIDLLDTAAARIKMGQSVQPAQLEALVERRRYIDARLATLATEQEQGLTIDDQLLETLEAELETVVEQTIELEQQWRAESGLVEAIQHYHARMNKNHEIDLPALQQLSADLRQELSLLQQQRPLVQPEVNSMAIANVVADWTGIPVGSMSKDDLQAVLTFEQTIGEQIIGQDDAISAIGRALRTSKAGIKLTNGPVGCFLLAGPSGVGKTETARAIATHLFGSEKALITINMSEYQEAHSVSQLKGSPPGYVGYGQGGVLTEAVRQRPYAVVLLDEVEKAHIDIMNMFYQVFDRGTMRDGEGRDIDFSNTLILMTSNLGADAIQQRFAQPQLSLEAGSEEGELDTWQAPSYSELLAVVQPAVQRHFAPALMARMQLVAFSSLSEHALASVVALKLDQLAQRLQAQHRLTMQCTEAVIASIASQCRMNDSGARYVNALLEQKLMPAIASQILHYLTEDDMPDIMRLDLDENEQLMCTFADLSMRKDALNEIQLIDIEQEQPQGV